MAMPRDECPRLLSLAVHEFRTPVTVVAGYLRMLLKMQPGLGDQPRKLLQEAEKSCTRLAALIAELSELSNLEAGHVTLDRRDVNLAALLDEVAAGVHEGADRGVRLEVRHGDGDAVLIGDRPQLARALEAVLTATLRERAEPGVIVAASGRTRVQDGAVAYVTIAPGAEGEATTFEPAEWDSFEPWRGGLGFRLVLAQLIVAAHGGTLFSGHGPRARAACALTLPVKES